MIEVYFILGSNLGYRSGYLLAGRNGIARQIAPVLRSSSIYETEPWGGVAGGPYLNQAVMVRTTLAPGEILKRIHQIEQESGRQRMQRGAPRTLDIDIAFYGDCVLHDVELEIPHPRLTERNFALDPLAEIAGDLIHPSIGRTLSQLQMASADHREVSIFIHE